MSADQDEDFNHENYPPGEELRLMLLGKTGSGKSCLGDGLLGCSTHGWFAGPPDGSPAALVSQTGQCQMATRLTRGRYLSVVDTPGTMDTNQPEEALMQLARAVAMFAEGGVHAFVITVRLDVRFTAEEEAAIDILCDLFGERFYSHAVVAFTHGDAYNNDEAKFFSSLEEACRKLSGLDRLMRLCDNRAVMLDNGPRRDRARQADQTLRLVVTVDQMVRANAAGAAGSPVYRNEAFALAQRELQGQLDRRSRQEDEALRQAIETERDRVRREFRDSREAERAKMMEEVAEAVFSALFSAVSAKGADECFPGEAVVQTPSGPVAMNQLSLGQPVLCVQNNCSLIYSPVYMWGHRDESSCSNSYVTVTTESAQLTLSSEHLLLTVDKTGHQISVAAGDVCAGHSVQVLHGGVTGGVKCEQVVTVQKNVMRRGLFAPFTLRGNIIVDGVLASCYIRCMSPALSHALLWPVRLAWRLRPSAVDSWNQLGDDGMPCWVSFVANRVLPRISWEI